MSTLHLETSGYYVIVAVSTIRKYPRKSYHGMSYTDIYIDRRTYLDIIYLNNYYRKV